MVSMRGSKYIFMYVYALCFSPEVVKNEPYGEKADIWALGCILYQMATLQPPFYSTNMLSLASKATHTHKPHISLQTSNVFLSISP